MVGLTRKQERDLDPEVLGTCFKVLFLFVLFLLFVLFFVSSLFCVVLSFVLWSCVHLCFLCFVDFCFLSSRIGLIARGLVP